MSLNDLLIEWIDPECSGELIDRDHWFAVKHGGVGRDGWHNIIPSERLEMVDGHWWELFHCKQIGTLGSEVWCWGEWHEGEQEVMVKLLYCRELTDNEKTEHTERPAGVYDIFTGEFKVTQTVPKFGE
jgi:hypothetical protein